MKFLNTRKFRIVLLCLAQLFSSYRLTMHTLTIYAEIIVYAYNFVGFSNFEKVYMNRKS